MTTEEEQMDELVQSIRHALTTEVEPAEEPKPTIPARVTRVRTMIADSSTALKNSIVKYRALEAELESEKSSATAEYQRVVEEARRIRDERLAEADTLLHQIRTTVEALEPARVKLAEAA